MLAGFGQIIPSREPRRYAGGCSGCYYCGAGSWQALVVRDSRAPRRPAHRDRPRLLTSSRQAGPGHYRARPQRRVRRYCGIVGPAVTGAIAADISPLAALWVAVPGPGIGVLLLGAPRHGPTPGHPSRDAVC